MLPAPTARLRFREMTEADIDLVAALLGDTDVMRFYPRPKTRDEAMRWIEWNQANYAEHGYGLWITETHEGDFVGDCYATEAARACLDLATGPIGESHVVAIINPANAPWREDPWRDL